ncbi:hypothetical protein [Nonomuraea sp. NPDC050691]
MEIDLTPVTTLFGGALIFPAEKAAEVKHLPSQPQHPARPRPINN